MEALPGLETGGLEFELLHILGQAAIPTGGTGLDAKHQFALLVLQDTAAHGQTQDQYGHAQ